MMIHDQVLSRHLSIDESSEHHSILETPSQTHHSVHIISPQTGSIKHVNIDLYSTSSFREHMQEELHLQVPQVLDLSRHNDSVETIRKTPSPYHSNSSAAGTPPKLSTKKNLESLGVQPFIHSSLLSKGMNMDTFSRSLSTSFFPSLYFPLTTNINDTNETINTAHPLNNLVQTFTSAAIMSPTVDTVKTETPNLSTDSDKRSLSTEMNTMSAFKTFPLNPLLKAANLGANNVFLDNPRLESYTKYRKRMLEEIHKSDEFSCIVKNTKIPHISSMSCANDNNSSECVYEPNVNKFSHKDLNKGNSKRTVASKAIAFENSKEGVVKNAEYYERRRKNNIAAKRSRDRRRKKEDEIAIRASYLERQNIELLYQINVLETQLFAYKTKTASP